MATIESPKELFTQRLGATYTMEQKILDMLENLEQEAQSSDLKQQLRHHRQETEQQVRNIEQAFRALGTDPETAPCPVVEGLEKEGKQNLKQVTDELKDSVILGGAAETEHHEIAVYRGLITKAEAMGEQDVVALLQENLEQEEHTRDEVEKAAEQEAKRLAQRAKV